MRRFRPDRDAGAAPRGTARVAALRLLGRREYTSAEIHDRLLRRGYSDDDVRSAVAALQGEGLIDDLRAALAHTRMASRVKGRGALRIRRELEARGLPPPVVATAVATLSDDDARQAIEHWLRRRSLPRPVPPARRRAVFQQLLRRGFPPGTIAEVLRMTPPEEDSNGE